MRVTLLALLALPQSHAFFSALLGRRPPAAPITTVILDADGTSLDPDHQMTPEVAKAICEAREAGLRVMLATGRARAGPWVERVLEPMDLEQPGVFLQGLTAFDASGKRIHDEFLEPSVVAAVEAVCEGDETITVCAYCREKLITPYENQRTQRYCDYDDAQCELPEEWEGCDVDADPWCIGQALAETLASGEYPGVSKLLVLGSATENIPALKTKMERALRGEPARVVRALDWTLEVLPAGSSKAVGVGVLLDSLGIDPSEVMAVGDGENDIEMLKMVGHPVAMGNAVPKLKRIARTVVGSNAQNGVAQAIREIAIPSRRRSEERQDGDAPDDA